MISMERTETTLIRGTGSRIISPGITTMTTSASTTMTRRSSPWTPGTSGAACSRARTSGSSTSTPRDAATATTWRPSGEGEENRIIMSNRTTLCDTSKLNNTSQQLTTRDLKLNCKLCFNTNRFKFQPIKCCSILAVKLLASQFNCPYQMVSCLI